MPDIRASEYVHLHVYAPCTSQRMKPFDDLRLYSIPPLPSDWTPPWDLIAQLNVFAGQLYLRDYKSYLRLCRFLDVPTKTSPNATTIWWNLFNIPGGFEEMEITFSGSPLLAVRNRGRPFAHTHIGKFLRGRLLTEKDFDGPASGSIRPPHSDLRCDTRNEAGPSALLRSSKRGLETAGISDADSEPSQKRRDDVTLESPSNDARDEPRSSTLLKPPKRGSEAAGVFDAGLEPLQKRPRAD